MEHRAIASHSAEGKWENKKEDERGKKMKRKVESVEESKRSGIQSWNCSLTTDKLINLAIKWRL